MVLVCTMASAAMAQEQKVQNRPYCDLRPFHFGVIVGTHWQDLEFVNVGYQSIEDGEGNMKQTLITCDQDRWENGFHVGVTGELRLNTYLQFRIAPSIYFGNRHMTFRNFTETDIDGYPMEQKQDMKTAYIGCNFDLIFASKRLNNHRPYVCAGITPMLNLTTKASDYLQLKSTDVFASVAIGCDMYLPFFKLRPELKFMYSLSNALNTNHKDELRDPAMKPYAGCVSSAKSRMIALTFYFE